jgi:protein-tyrosine phosphatase
MCAYGIATVIDLRTESERNGTFDTRFPRPHGETLCAQGVRYLHHELVDDASLKRVGEATDMYERYLKILSTRQAAFGAIFAAIADAEGGVLFHCFAGKDRTGLVAALLLALAGVSPDDIAADFGETDVQLADQYEKWISLAPADVRETMRDELRCPPERILGVLDFVETRWGGPQGYMEDCGVDANRIDRLASRLK